MVRVAGLVSQMDAGITDAGPDGMPPRAQLIAIRREMKRLVADAYKCLAGLQPELDEAGIRILDYSDLNEVQAARRQQLLHRIGVSRFDSAGLRSGPSLPAHFQPQPEPGRADPRQPGQRALRAHQGSRFAASAGSRKPRRDAQAKAPAIAIPSRIRVAGASDRGSSGCAVSWNAGAGGASLSRHPRRRHGDQGTGSGGPARKHRSRRAAEALRETWCA